MKARDIDRVDLKGGGFVAQPDTGGRLPGVVVIHEAYGLNDGIKEITRRFAREGYVALAVDLFAGRNRAVCMARFMAGMLRGSVDRFGVGDLKQALSYLMALPEVDSDRVGAIGFCMGGSFAVAWEIPGPSDGLVATVAKTVAISSPVVDIKPAADSAPI